MKPSMRILAVLAASLSAAILAGGCDTNENADLDRGRELFTAKCGSCHILAEASTTGVLGPDLDAAFAQARADGTDTDYIEGIVEAQIETPRQVEDPATDPSYMPPGLVEGQDAVDVSAYVASVAGVPNIEPPEAPGGEGGAIFANNGCGGCHVFTPAESAGTTGPNLDETLEGQSAEQIETSIVAPDEQIVSGFSAGIMPQNYGEVIPPGDLATLVEFLLGGGPGGETTKESGDEMQSPSETEESP